MNTNRIRRLKNKVSSTSTFQIFLLFQLFENVWNEIFHNGTIVMFIIATQRIERPKNMFFNILSQQEKFVFFPRKRCQNEPKHKILKFIENDFRR